MRRMDLFRMKIILAPLFEREREKKFLIRDVVDKAFAAQKANKSRRIRWLMGRPEVREGTLRFNFGKTSPAMKGRFDDKQHDFVQQEEDSATYTPVYINLEYGVVGIVRNSEVAGDTVALAKRIADVLLRGCDHNAIENVTVAPMYETADLMKIVDDAHEVTTLGFVSTPPNPWDSPDFSEQVQGFVRDTRGTQAKLVVSGDDLDKGVVKRTLRDENALGHQTYVRVRDKLKGRTMMKKFKDIAHIPCKDPLAFSNIACKVKDAYKKIKSGDEN